MPEAQNKFQNDLTSGHVSKQLLKFSLPFLGAMLFQALYNVADMVIVGWYEGSIGISGVGIGGQVAVLITNAGCTISSHCGPNTLGILFIRKAQ